MTCSACGEIWFEHGIEAEVIRVGGGAEAVVAPRPVAEHPAPDPEPEPEPATDQAESGAPSSSAAPRPELVAPTVTDLVAPGRFAPSQVTIWHATLETCFEPSCASETGPTSLPELEEVATPETPAAHGSTTRAQDAPSASSASGKSKGHVRLDAVLMAAGARLRAVKQALMALWPQRRPPLRTDAGLAAAFRARQQARSNLRNRLTWPRIVGWSLWATTVALTGVLLSDREVMERIWPRTAHVYDQFFGRPETAKPFELAGLSSRLAESIDGPVLELRGRVINRGQGEYLPLLTLSFEGPELHHRETVPIAETALPEGGERPFLIRATLPEGAQRAGLTLRPGDELSAKAGDGFILQRQGSGWGSNAVPPLPAMTAFEGGQ